ncbi:hypothetical protein ATCVMN08101_630L [Acanthocystis turfacea Chlorella virus MN0810.1]|nr:hypothetical protein ATCVMN08101_630L [Acanthocystis turfacea Chlorella virus MN0810.1]
MNTLLILVLALIVIAAAWWFFAGKKENFTMTLYRPTYEYNIPPTTWDPRDILTAVLPTGKDKPPKLAVELGDYRRFQRI